MEFNLYQEKLDLHTRERRGEILSSPVGAESAQGSRCSQKVSTIPSGMKMSFCSRGNRMFP